MKTVEEEHEKPGQSELGRSGRSLRPSALVEGRPRTLTSGTHGTGALKVMAGHRSRPVSEL